MKTGYAFQLPHVAATNLLHDIGQFKIPDRERKLIQDFTMYLNRGAIVEANDFPSMENLRSVMDSVINLIIRYGMQFSFRDRKCIAEFILALTLWSITPERHKFSENPVLHDFLINFERDMGYTEDEQFREDSDSL